MFYQSGFNMRSTDLQGFLGLHPFWTERYGKASFPMADRIHHCGFFLPNNPSLSLETIDRIAGVALGALR